MSRRGENVYKRSDGRWEGRVLKGNGKYQYFYAKTYREVKEKMKSQQVVPQKNTIIITDMQDAVTLFESWLNNLRTEEIKPSTYESYRGCMHNYVLPFFYIPENNRLEEETICCFVDKIRNHSSISLSYQIKILTILKTALKSILGDTALGVSVIKVIKIPKAVRKETQVFTMQDQRLIEHAVLHSKDKRVLGIILCFYTGIRIGELCALRWEDFDTEAGIMSVSRTVSRTKNYGEGRNKTILNIGTPKSPKSIRKIPLPEFLLKLVIENEMYDKNKSCYVLSEKPTPIDPRYYEKIYKSILEIAGVKERKFHAIRHTFATRALELGVDIKTLSELLGHSSVTITLNIYAHSLMEQKKIAIDKFNHMHLTHMEPVPISVQKIVTTF